MNFKKKCFSNDMDENPNFRVQNPPYDSILRVKMNQYRKD